MREIIKIEYLSSNRVTYALFDSRGDAIDVINDLMKTNSFCSLSYETKKRYSNVYKIFITYLYNVVNKNTKSQLTEILSMFEYVYSLGADVKFDNKYNNNELFCIIKKFVVLGKWRPKKRGSLHSVRAAMKMLYEFIKLNYCNNLFSSLINKNLIIEFKYSMIDSAFSGFTRGLARPYVTNRKISRQVESDKIFPMQNFTQFLNSVKNYRNKSLWGILGATGLRESEGLSLRWSQIDFNNCEISVSDLKENIYNSDKNIHYKGRCSNNVYFIPELKNYIFEILIQYRVYSYRPTVHDYVFLILQGDKKYQPLFKSSYSCRNKQFKKALRIAEVPGDYGVHSLRHMYGNYMANYAKYDGSFGVPLKDLQVMLGHASIKSTQIYCKRNEEIIKENLSKYYIGKTNDSKKILEKYYSEKLEQIRGRK